MKRALTPAAFLLALLSGLAAAPLRGQGPALVRDINVSGGSGFSSSMPHDFLTVGSRIFFVATPPAQGGFFLQVAVTDGTPLGTEFLGAPCLDPSCGSKPALIPASGASPAGDTGDTGETLFFTTETDFSEHLLWRSDGTRAGTFPLTTPGLALDPAGDQPGAYVRIGRELFFGACAGGQCGLYKSDGTVSGTGLVAALDAVPLSLTPLGKQLFFIARGEDGSLTLYVSDGTASGTRSLVRSPSFQLDGLTAATGRVFFFGGDLGDTQGEELWTSDGTAAGTRAVTSFEAANPFDSTQPLLAVGGNLYFVADDVTHGPEIWKSDGTPTGTRRVTEFGYDQPFSNPLRMEALGQRLLFLATDGIHPTQLWSTTGTPESTAPVASITASASLLVPAGPSHLLFIGFDNPQGAGQVWTTDGTAGGTRPLFPGCPGSACGNLSAGPFALGGAAFLVEDDAARTPFLWRTDGTAAGTRRWSDETVVPIFHSSFAGVPGLAALGGRVFYNGMDTDTIDNEELWSSDGRSGGTHLVADLSRQAPGSAPAALTAVGGEVFFTATDGVTTSLWRSAGTAGSTQPLAGAARSLTATPGLLFFTQSDTDGMLRLWRTDGTASGTRELPSSDGARLVDGVSVAYRGQLAFAQQRGAGVEVWQSDGTDPGTGLLFALPSVVVGIEDLTAFGNELYFVADDAQQQRTVWRSDGTAAGTRQISPSIGYRVDPHFVRLAPWVFFVGFDDQDRFVLWRTDGTPGGTTAVHKGFFLDIIDITDPVVFGGALYFFAPTSATRRGIFRSDGTEAGTALVLELGAEADEPPSFPGTYPAAEFTLVGDRLFFVGDDGVHGRELWRSDGTAAGTVLVRDIFPGFLPSSPTGLTAAAGRLYFSADDSVHGRELWQSDGTAAGTRLVEDVAPGADSSSPSGITATTDRLYWSAEDELHGRELWSLPLAGPTGCQPGDTRLCLTANRFQVEIAWKDFQGNTGVGHAVPLTADTGYFWFFASTNVETVVKVLDARALNQAFWVFYGALSNVEYTMTVTDTQTGLTRRYFNPAGQLASVGDTAGFGPLGAYLSETPEVPASGFSFASELVSARTDARAATGTCTPGAQRLCLQGGRFAVTAAWQDFQGKTGTGTAVSLTPDTGYFWFFDPANVEVMTKVLDGRAVTGKFWFFYGALSNVAYTLTVTDTQTGAVKTYKNPSGQFGSVADTGAF